MKSRGFPRTLTPWPNSNGLLLWSNVIGHFPPSLSHLEFLQELDLLNNEMSVDEQIMGPGTAPWAAVCLSVPRANVSSTT